MLVLLSGNGWCLFGMIWCSRCRYFDINYVERGIRRGLAQGKAQIPYSLARALGHGERSRLRLVAFFACSGFACRGAFCRAAPFSAFSAPDFFNPASVSGCDER